MNTNKILVGGIVGGIVFFFLGWLIYGILLAGYMAANGNTCIMRPMEQMIWWALIISNLVWGFLLAIIFSWSNTTGWMAGAKKAAIFTLLLGLAIDLGYYSMSTMYSNMMAVFVDILTSVAMTTIGGAIIAWAMSMVKKES
jgi:ABC-type molybdate transport system permease subunit